MLLDYLLGHPWLVVIAWVCLSSLEFALSLVAVRLYYAGGNKHMASQGYEEDSYNLRGASLFRRLSPRFLLTLIVTTAVLSVAGFTMWNATALHKYLELLYGGMYLLLLLLLDRHVQSIITDLHYTRSQGIAGRLIMSDWFTYRISALQMFIWALFFLLFFLLTNRWFFLGGVASCIYYSLHYRDWSWRSNPEVSLPEATSIDGERPSPETVDESPESKP